MYVMKNTKMILILLIMSSYVQGVRPGWGWGIASPWKRPDIYSLKSSAETTAMVQSRKRSLRRCYSETKGYELKDATVWLKCPGESDGRLYQYGAFRKCLIGHRIECDSTCPLVNHQGVSNLNSGCSCNYNSIYRQWFIDKCRIIVIHQSLAVSFSS